MTWDGQPAGETAAAIKAVIAAAWCAGRDAAAKIADRKSMLDGDCDHLGPTDPESGVRECALELRDEVCPCAERTQAAESMRDAIRALAPPADLVSTLRPGRVSMPSEQIAAAAIAQTLCAREPVAGPKNCSEPCPGCLEAGRDAVEAISAAELVIVPAGRMAELLEVERKARALLGSEDAMAAAHAGDADRAAKFDPWPEADALVAALRELVA